MKIIKKEKLIIIVLRTQIIHTENSPFSSVMRIGCVPKMAKVKSIEQRIIDNHGSILSPTLNKNNFKSSMIFTWFTPFYIIIYYIVYVTYNIINEIIKQIRYLLCFFYFLNEKPKKNIKKKSFKNMFLRRFRVNPLFIPYGLDAQRKENSPAPSHKRDHPPSAAVAKVFVRVVPPLRKSSEHKPFQWKETTAPICSYLTKLSPLFHFFHRGHGLFCANAGGHASLMTGGQSPHHLTAVGGLKSLGRFATVAAPPKKITR